MNDSTVHITELAAVALVKDDHNMLLVDLMPRIFLDEGRQLLDGGDDSMGMTDNQYKGMLLDQLEDWQEVLDLAIKAGNTEIQEKVEKQIRKINEKLKF